MSIYVLAGPRCWGLGVTQEGWALLHSESLPAPNFMLHKPLCMGGLQGLHLLLIWS